MQEYSNNPTYPNGDAYDPTYAWPEEEEEEEEVESQSPLGTHRRSYTLQELILEQKRLKEQTGKVFTLREVEEILGEVANA